MDAGRPASQAHEKNPQGLGSSVIAGNDSEGDADPLPAQPLKGRWLGALDGTPDPTVLRATADAGRMLVTGDLRTMRVHFQDFVVGRDSPGVLLVPSIRSIGAAIEGLTENDLPAQTHNHRKARPDSSQKFFARRSESIRYF